MWMYKKKQLQRDDSHTLINDKWTAASTQEGQWGDKMEALGMDLTFQA